MLIEEVIINALSLGVQGYLTAESIVEQFSKAIMAISKNEIWAERKILIVNGNRCDKVPRFG